ncbi:TolB amino-terminal domain-containing protein [Salinihabitans flavidus]|uniref:TolB amino-terminal domain-containing protein n=1 Tax=Salinihabitans flavidus TaxID=569882 RepID=A0A1H8RKH4_9RHOB|nr:winged helix-turn-helix domain-containing protein [Salinihabitans flavidus]SEO66900.1 TolB amino-terminal domain-containing protein [Salinihabitans flavidus]
MTWTFGEFNLDPERFQLVRRGVAVSLEPQVLALLIQLVRNHNRMVSKDEIVETVWSGKAVSDASISSRVRSARQAVDDDGTRQKVIQTVHGRGFRFVAAVTSTTQVQVTSGAPPEHLSGRPSIAILPFRLLVPEAGLAVLAEAIPHEIIEALSRLRWLAVIARGSSFRFGMDTTDVDLVASALSARYVLSGIIERRGTGIAVTLELEDTGTRQVLWADRLESPLDGIDELRSRIVAHLIAAFETHIPLNEARVARLRNLEDLDAWANYHVGLRHLYRFTASDTEQARACFERAIAAEPDFARARAGLSFTSFLTAFLRLESDIAAAARSARHHAERALELDALDPFANFTMGRSFWLTDQPEVAADWLARATTLNPNYAQGFYASAFTAMLLGDRATTITALDTSLHLSPLDPLLYGVHGVRAQSLMQQEDYEAAAIWGDRAVAQPGAHYLIGMIALAANGLVGRHERAGQLRQDIRRRKPDATAADYFTAFPTRHAASRSRIAAELARQGF